jgi:hypothetical protein
MSVPPASGWRARAAGAVLYLAWGTVAALGLAAAGAYDPYVLAFAAFGCGGVSGVLAMVAAFHGRWAFGCAALAALPSAAAFVVLGGYRWA